MFTRFTQCFLSCCPDVTDEDAYQPSQSLLSAQQPVPAETQCGSSATSLSMSMTATRSLLPAEDEANAQPRTGGGSAAAAAAAVAAVTASASHDADSACASAAASANGSAAVDTDVRSAAAAAAASRSEPVPILARSACDHGGGASQAASASKLSSTVSTSTGHSSPTVGSLEMYNAMLGLSGRLDDEELQGRGADPSLNTETCSICCSEIILGPQEAVARMQIPPGERPRHFECGHALHSDCFAVYTCSSPSGHACPICAIERSDSLPLSASYLAALDAGNSNGNESGEGEGGGGRYLPGEEADADSFDGDAGDFDGDRGGGFEGGGGGGGFEGGEPPFNVFDGGARERESFSADAVLQALSLAGLGRRGDDDGEGEAAGSLEIDDEEAAEAAREELELQAALQLSVRRE